MAATAFVRARIDEKIRDEAATVLAEMGLRAMMKSREARFTDAQELFNALDETAKQ